jgi:DNA-binding transcriptional LysR family regulator
VRRRILEELAQRLDQRHVHAAMSRVVLAYVWADRSRPHLASGELVECLASWRAPEDWLYLYDPTRKHISAGLRAVVEALRV